MFKTEIDYSNWLHRNCESCNRYECCYYCPLRKILLDDYAYIPIFEKGAATLQNPKLKNQFQHICI